MTTLYVKEQGSVVGRDGERLVIRKGGAVLEDGTHKGQDHRGKSLVTLDQVNVVE